MVAITNVFQENALSRSSIRDDGASSCPRVAGLLGCARAMPPATGTQEMLAYPFRRLITAILIVLAASPRTRAMPVEAGQPIIEAAQTQFGQLSQAETRLLRALSTGSTIWCGPNEKPTDPANDPAAAASWGPQRAVRSEVLRWVLVDPLPRGRLHPGGIELGGAIVKGKFDLSFLDLTVPLTLRQCAIPDEIDLSSVQSRTLSFWKSRTGRIRARRAMVRGDLIFTDANLGPVLASRAQIDGDLNCAGAHMDSGEVVFNAMQSVIGGNASFSEGFETDGTIELSLVKVGGNLSFYDAHFSGRAKNGLSAVSAAVAGALYWVSVTLGDSTQLDLTQAKLGALWDDKPSWPASDNLFLDGLLYDSLVGPSDAESRLEWLDRQPRSYWPQPYLELAKALDGMGQEADAANVRIAKEDALRLYGNVTFAKCCWKLILKLTIGYGYKPTRALWWMAGFVIFGAVLFSWGYRAGAILATGEEPLGPLEESPRPAGYHPPFDARIFSLDQFLPIVELYQKGYWLPKPGAGPKLRLPMVGAGLSLGTLLHWYLLLHILAGWILTPLFLAGLSGLVHPGG
jgi:hypothetical protein